MLIAVKSGLNDFLKQRLETERERRQSVQLATEFHAFKLNAFIPSRVIELVELTLPSHAYLMPKLKVV